MWQVDLIKPLLSKFKTEEKGEALLLIKAHFKKISFLDKELCFYKEFSELFISQGLISYLYYRYQNTVSIDLQEFTISSLGFLSFIIRICSCEERFNSFDFMIDYIKQSPNLKEQIGPFKPAFEPLQDSGNSLHQKLNLFFKQGRDSRDVDALKEIEASAFSIFPDCSEERFRIVNRLLHLDYFYRLLQDEIQPSKDSLIKLLTHLYFSHISANTIIQEAFEQYIGQVKGLFFNPTMKNQTLMS